MPLCFFTDRNSYVDSFLSSGLATPRLWRTSREGRTTARHGGLQWRPRGSLGVATKGQGDTQTRCGGDGAPVAPASKAPCGAREGILEMAANAGGESVASSSDGAPLARRAETLQTGAQGLATPGALGMAGSQGMPTSDALGLATLGAAMDREDHGDPPMVAGHLADAPALGTASLEPGDQGLHTPGALDAVEPPTDASAEAWARELLPTVPHPAIHYNLPVLHVQRY
jgi:hypothetical protein